MCITYIQSTTTTMWEDIQVQGWELHLAFEIFFWNWFRWSIQLLVEKLLLLPTLSEHLLSFHQKIEN